MISIKGWKKFFLFILICTPITLLILNANSFALFGPEVVDVTTRAFSVVLTLSQPYSNLDIELSSYGNPVQLEEDQKIVETDPNQPGEDGKAYGLGKITVIGLNYNTPYSYVLKNGGSAVDTGDITTQNLSRITTKTTT